MIFKDELMLNKFGQNLIDSKVLVEKFISMNLSEKKVFLTDTLYLILQSKPLKEDIEQAIIDSNLSSKFTPCVMSQKGVDKGNLSKIINLPENELVKTFQLFISLFKIAYQRRFQKEKNDPNKWWYWDMKDKNNLEKLERKLL